MPSALQLRNGCRTSREISRNWALVVRLKESRARSYTARVGMPRCARAEDRTRTSLEHVPTAGRNWRSSRAVRNVTSAAFQNAAEARGDPEPCDTSHDGLFAGRVV